MSSTTGEHGEEGLPQDQQIERERPVLHVSQIKAQGVLTAEIRAAADLPQAGQAGVTNDRRTASLCIAAISARGAGGADQDMLPRSTLNSWGSSSSEKSLRNCPSLVTRGSWVSLKSAPWPSLELDQLGQRCSASTTMERNLNMVNGSPFRPISSGGKSPARRPPA